jgi:CheY-like chemotaxis protein
MDSIGRLAGGVAHDFNNLLAVILGYVGLAQADVPPGDPLHTMLVEIKHAGERAATLTRQLLAFSRKQVLQPVAFNLNEVVTDLEKMLRRILGEDIAFRVVLAPDLDAILADPGQIEQVIVNMAVNARDAMPTGGKLTIETANVEIDDQFLAHHMDVKPGHYVQLAVTDTGVGIDAPTQSQLFEPFFTTKETGEGTGLGLAMAYGIVKQSGGDIGVYSELGKGTTFKVYLPRTEHVSLGKAERGTESIIRGRGERILVVEDETALRNLLDRMLTSWGYQVTLTADADQALAAVATMEGRPDLVLTDVVMPGSSGAVLAERLRQIQPDLKVLFMSGYTDNAIVHHGVLDSGLPFIQKPFRSADLAVKIAGLLQERKPQPPAKKKVLMIDDEQLVRDLVGWACKKRGHDFVGVGNVTAALQALAAKSFDVLLVDMNLLGRDGADALREIRAAGHSPPAVIFSGDVGSVDMDVLRPLGAVACLEKSGNTGPLMKMLETVTAAKARII